MCNHDENYASKLRHIIKDIKENTISCLKIDNFSECTSSLLNSLYKALRKNISLTTIHFHDITTESLLNLTQVLVILLANNTLKELSLRCYILGFELNKGNIFKTLQIDSLTLLAASIKKNTSLSTLSFHNFLYIRLEEGKLLLDAVKNHTTLRSIDFLQNFTKVESIDFLQNRINKENIIFLYQKMQEFCPHIVCVTESLQHYPLYSSLLPDVKINTTTVPNINNYKSSLIEPKAQSSMQEEDFTLDEEDNTMSYVDTIINEFEFIENDNDNITANSWQEKISQASFNIKTLFSL